MWSFFPRSIEKTLPILRAYDSGNITGVLKLKIGSFVTCVIFSIMCGGTAKLIYVCDVLPLERMEEGGVPDLGDETIFRI